MLNTSKYISTNSIIESLARDADYDNVSIGDLLEWIWEVISYMNIPMYYTEATTTIEIDNYRGRLPFNFYKETQIRDTYSEVPYIKTTNIFYHIPDKDSINDVQAHINVDGGTEELSTSNLSSNKRIIQREFNIRDGWIYVEFETGDLEMAYKAYPLDESGFPLIPEDAKFMRAIKTFLIKNLDYKAWRKGIIPKDIYQDSEQNYYYAVAAAQSHSNMPDLATLETIRRFSSLMVSDPNQYAKSFKHLNK
jgi:hypothetical protein